MKPRILNLYRKEKAIRHASWKSKKKPLFSRGSDYIGYWIVNGGPNGNRTRVSGVRGQRPRPLDDGTCLVRRKIVQIENCKVMLINLPKFEIFNCSPIPILITMTSATPTTRNLFILVVLI